MESQYCYGWEKGKKKDKIEVIGVEKVNVSKILLLFVGNKVHHNISILQYFSRFPWQSLIINICTTRYKGALKILALFSSAHHNDNPSRTYTKRHLHHTQLAYVWNNFAWNTHPIERSEKFNILSWSDPLPLLSSSKDKEEFGWKNHDWENTNWEFCFFPHTAWLFWATDINYKIKLADRLMKGHGNPSHGINKNNTFWY